MNSIPLQTTDESHTLLTPNLHDGELIGIRLPVKGVVELSVAEMSGKRYRIVLEGIWEFYASEFREGNIILDVTVARGGDVQISDVRSLGNMDPGLQRSEENLERIHKRILAESLYLLELNPSYGCHLIGIARNVSVFGEDEH